MIFLGKPSTYFRCIFIIKRDRETIKYRIDHIVNIEHPFKLQKHVCRDRVKWESLSVYASVRDSVGALLNDLFSPELQEEIDHGQASINSGAVLSKIEVGERCIVIHQTADSKALLSEEDIDFDNLVVRPTTSPNDY